MDSLRDDEKGEEMKREMGRIKCGSLVVILTSFVSLLLGVAALAGTNVWTSGGPVGGLTIVSMATDPSSAAVLYASLLYGPLFKTADGGAHWSQLSLAVPAYNSVGAIAVDPTNSNIVYAAWYGVAKSTDGGTSWTGFGGPSAYIKSIVIDPVTPTTLYGGSNGNGVYKSTNSGSTWDLAASGLTNKSVTILVLDPASHLTLYAATSGGGVFKSTDGAGTWNAANTGLGNLSVQGLTMDFGTGKLYAGTQSGVYMSSNGGASWSAAGLAGQNLATIIADPYGAVYAANGSGGLWKSSDGGTTWPSISAGLPGTRVYAIAPNPTTSGALHVGTTNGGVYSTTDSGTTWAAQNTGLGSHLKINEVTVDPVAPSHLYAGSTDGIYKSTDGGSNWTRIAFAGSSVQSIIADDSTTPTRLYASVWGSGVNVSTDGGTTWNNINNGAFLPNILCVGQDPNDASILYAGTNGNGFFKTTNGGTTWSDVSGTTLPAGANWGCVAFDKAHAGTLYAGRQDSDQIYKTVNAGSTWTSVYSGPDSGIYSIAVAPFNSNWVYAASYGNTNGLIKSSNAGSSWTALHSGLSCLGVRGVALDPVVPGTLYIGITGCQYSPTGVYKSIDDGASWFGMNSGLGNTMVEVVALDPTNRATVYAGTDGGVYSLTQVAPSVTSVSPASGPATGGTTVTITGAGFTGALAVNFGASPAAGFTVNSDTQITAVSPAHGSGPVDVKVTILYGTSAASSSDVFTFNSGSVFKVPFSVAPLRASSSDNGASATITWDATNCANSGYHLIYGYGSTLPSWTVSGGVCGLGTSGSTTWSGIPSPSSDSKHFLWFLVVGDDGANMEGSWGTTSSGTERGSGPSNVCGMTVRSTSATCGTP